MAENAVERTTEKPSASVDFAEYAEALRQLTAENPTMTLHVPPPKLVAIIAALQLALRHPNLPAATYKVCDDFCRSIQASIEEYHPLVAKVIEMGFDPQFDEEL